MTKGDLFRQFQEKIGGSWELIATAAGNLVSLTKSRHGLERVELNRAFESDHLVSPSFTLQRVSALATFNTQEIARLWISWQPIQTINYNVFWEMALYAAIPYLKDLEIVSEAEIKASPFRDYVPKFWIYHSPTEKFWQEIVNEYKNGVTSTCGNSDIILKDQKLSSVDLHGAPMECLSFLVDRTELLDHTAQDYLSRLLAQQLESPNDLLPPIYLVQICAKLNLATVNRLYDWLAESLKITTEPETYIDIVYALIRA